MEQARLITIPFSHYCEKARWVLDATGVTYREEPHVPIAHLRATRKVGGKTVPVLVHGDVVLCDSSDIARHAEGLADEGRRLVPAQRDARVRVLAIEDELDETLGVDARLLAYWHTLGDEPTARGFMGRMLRIRSPLAQRAAAAIFRAMIYRVYRVNAATARRAEARVRSTFARLGEALEKDDYLVAGRFTLADLTLAALASPLLAPPEHPITGGSKAGPAPGLASLRAELSAMPAGRHALRVYREHRAGSG